MYQECIKSLAHIMSHIVHISCQHPEKAHCHIGSNRDDSANLDGVSIICMLCRNPSNKRSGIRCKSAGTIGIFVTGDCRVLVVHLGRLWLDDVVLVT